MVGDAGHFGLIDPQFHARLDQIDHFAPARADRSRRLACAAADC
jgi:hypothetical protein